MTTEGHEKIKCDCPVRTRGEVEPAAPAARMSPAWPLMRLCGPKAGACGRRTLHRIRETGGGTPPPSGTLNHRHKGSLTMAKLGAFTAAVLLAAATALAGAAYAKGGGGGGHGGGHGGGGRGAAPPGGGHGCPAARAGLPGEGADAPRAGRAGRLGPPSR